MARSPHRVVLAPGVGSLTELGAEDPDALLDPARLATGARAVRLAGASDVHAWRVPLPGTLDEGGRMLEAPRGAGTGWLAVRVFPGRRTDALRLRCSAPASRSPAAREWNLLCHLAANGVAAPGVVALVERSRSGFVESSCVVTRELEGHLPAGEWLAGHSGQERALALEGAGGALARLFRARVWLPGFGLDHLLIEHRPAQAAAEVRADDCAAETLLRVRARGAARSELAERGLAVRALPGVAVASVAGGRLATRIGERRKRDLLARLADQAAAAGVGAEELGDVLALALA